MFISAGYQDNYHKAGKCGVHNIPSDDLRDEENLFFGNCYSSHYGYTSDDDGSETWCNEQYVCVLGPSCSDNRQQMNHCWFADTDGPWGDEWDEGYSLTECTGGKWTPNSADKIQVFVNQSDEVIQSDKGLFPSSIVEPASFNLKCYAYICKNGTYGCKDGSCPAAGQSCDKKQTDTELPTKHRNTAQPYLQALKSTCEMND